MYWALMTLEQVDGERDRVMAMDQWQRDCCPIVQTPCKLQVSENMQKTTCTLEACDALTYFFLNTWVCLT